MSKYEGPTSTSTDLFKKLSKDVNRTPGSSQKTYGNFGSYCNRRRKKTHSWIVRDTDGSKGSYNERDNTRKNVFVNFAVLELNKLQ